MKITIIQVPYDSGHRGARMGRGPDHLVERGADARLRNRGHDVIVERVDAPAGRLPTEIGTSFELYRMLADRVRRAVETDRFPLVLAGNCCSALGTVSGAGPADLGIIWFDAHGDFNSPESTVTGLLDGMAVQIVAGRCWSAIASSVPGFQPVPESNIVMVGVRDVDPLEASLLAASDIQVIDADRVRRDGPAPVLAPALEALGGRVRGVYLHVDLDVVDAEEARANFVAAPDGLGVPDVEASIRMIKDRFDVCAAAITALDPTCDDRDRAAEAGLRFMEAIVS